MPYIYKSGLQFGITEQNIYGGADCVELTQAEYDALSEAEKHNGQIYFIIDSNYDFLIVNDSVPIGSIQAYGGLTAPNNWLICDGRAISRTEYSELFHTIGITYGEGDGNTTFNIPDLTGRVITGAGTLDNNTYTLGEQKTAGLPNITGEYRHSWADGSGGGFVTPNGNAANNIGALGNKHVGTAYFGAAATSSTDNYHANYLTFDASKADPIYGNSTTVQPNSTVANYIIKAKNPKVSSGQADMFYPVGSYFETSDVDFDPNDIWGGTWNLQMIINEEEDLIYNGSFTTGTASLINNVNNYRKIKIIANDNDNQLKTFEVMNENSNTFSTYLDFGRIAGGWYAKCMVVTFNGTSMTENFNKQAYFSTISAEGTYVTVEKVYGYKQTTSYKWHRIT